MFDVKRLVWMPIFSTSNARGSSDARLLRFLHEMPVWLLVSESIKARSTVAENKWFEETECETE